MEFDPPAITNHVAIIEPIAGSATNVSGTAVVSTIGGGGAVFYGGFFSGLEPLLSGDGPECMAVNGCGLHIHSGFGCEDTEAQGGHYFVDPISEDPWVDARYSTNTEGGVVHGAIVDIGTHDVIGRAMLVHAPDGSRIGCGLLVPADSLTGVVELETETTPLESGLPNYPGVRSAVNVITGIPDDSELSERLCYAGYAIGLMANVSSFQQGGDACSAANGCGTHIHAGLSCEPDGQLGHWYNADVLEVDPWLLLGYLTTDVSGNAFFGYCTETGFPSSDAEGRAFIVHGEDGSRVSCSILEAVSAPETQVPTLEMTEPKATDEPVGATVVELIGRPEGTHALSKSDAEELGLGDGNFVLLTKIFNGDVDVVNLDTFEVQNIVPSIGFQSRGGAGVYYAFGHIIVCSLGPFIGNPFEIYIYDPATGSPVATCSSPGVEPGMFNDLDVVGDMAYVTDSRFNRLWNFNIPSAIASGSCELSYDILDEDIFLGAGDTPIRSNGIVAFGNGFLIALFQTGGLYYVEPSNNVTEALIPLGELELPDGLEMVTEEDGTNLLYITEGGGLISVYSIVQQNDAAIPLAQRVGSLTSNAYVVPGTSAVVGDYIWTADLGDTSTLPAVGESDPSTFNTTFYLIGVDRRLAMTPDKQPMEPGDSSAGSARSLFVGMSAALIVLAISSF